MLVGGLAGESVQGETFRPCAKASRRWDREAVKRVEDLEFVICVTGIRGTTDCCSVWLGLGRVGEDDGHEFPMLRAGSLITAQSWVQNWVWQSCLCRCICAIGFHAWRGVGVVKARSTCSHSPGRRSSVSKGDEPRGSPTRHETQDSRPELERSQCVVRGADGYRQPQADR